MKKYVQNRLSVWIVTILSTLLIAVSSGIALATPITPEQQLEEYWNRFFLEETETIMRIATYREEGRQVDYHLQITQDLLKYWAEAFNDEELTKLKLRFFEWDSGTETEEGTQTNPPQYKVFGFRIGEGPRKISILAHLDVVPPGSDVWQPFQPRQVEHDYQPSDSNELKELPMWGEQTFLVGRGAIDDKGPAISTFIVLKTLAKQFDKTPEVLENVTLELLFDTSEETDMSTPHYLEYLENNGQADKKPDVGIVFDAMWCVRAEKGIEFPTFSLVKSSDKDDKKAAKKMYIDDLYTADNGSNPANQIPDTATAIIKFGSEIPNSPCQNLEKIYNFKRKVDKTQQPCPFWLDKGECPYKPAELECVENEDNVTLTTKVEGTQHGSSPHENREHGANPLVSLTNFLGDLAEKTHFADNSIAKMTRFIRWSWGTQVFGEKHPELLLRNDKVFKETDNNGTTYAVTNIKTDTDKITLAIDIRYAINHHLNDDKKWNGESGVLPGKISRFGQREEKCTKHDCLLQKLVDKFNSEHKSAVTTTPDTKYAPDIRNPKTSAEFQKINTAFREVIGQDCPQLAIGGGTDAKGHNELWAAGALFDTKMGPPVNYHGQNEGAPIEHLKLGTQIMYRFMCNEIPACAGIETSLKK
jgi:succinyl-diaminopimelate desuccinylase